MLVLTRKVQQTIVIGEGENRVEVVVLEVRGEQVRIGVNAPRTVKVHRKEVWDQIQHENLSSSQTRPEDVPDVE